MRIKFKKPVGKRARIRFRKRPEPVFDETELIGKFFKNWASHDKTLSYLKVRFRVGHPMGDWLKKIAKIRVEMRNE